MNTLLQIPHVAPEMLSADFWLQRIPNPDTPLLEPNQIADFNERVHKRLNIPDAFDLPDALPKAAVEELINRNGVPDNRYYGGAGQLLDDRYYERLMDNVTPDSLPVQVPIQFGLVTQRTSARVLPTFDVANDELLELKTDLFQATALDIGWPVAVVATSRDGYWYFCLTPLYWGWVNRADIALASRDAVHAYCQPDDWVVAQSSRKWRGNATDGQPLATY